MRLVFPRRFRTRLALILLVSICLWVPAAFFFSPVLLRLQDPPARADVMVLLGGEVFYRPQRALELYQQAVAPRIIITGKGDCEEYRIFLVGKGVPTNAVQIECESRTTRENAKFTVPLLREQKAKRVILVTSWFHSRRAKHCFEHEAPDLEFISLPTEADVPGWHWPYPRERGWAMLEYLKMPYYLLRYGIWPI
jgi:uncharacterized SAM-binding protein YcdF (DUF218 family)